MLVPQHWPEFTRPRYVRADSHAWGHRYASWKVPTVLIRYLWLPLTPQIKCFLPWLANLQHDLRPRCLWGHSSWVVYHKCLSSGFSFFSHNSFHDLPHSSSSSPTASPPAACVPSSDSVLKGLTTGPTDVDTEPEPRDNTLQPLQREDVHVWLAAGTAGNEEGKVCVSVWTREWGEVQSCGIKKKTQPHQANKTAGATLKGAHGEKKVRKVKARVH